MTRYWYLSFGPHEEPWIGGPRSITKETFETNLANDEPRITWFVRTPTLLILRLDGHEGFWIQWKEET